ncbi:MerR family transcriptional regulator [Gluconobacter sphaericus]|uniref:MerR family transcriptional regulator n=1 Tax=Gluconobacter sphaericus TaxID=574987 RepID=UPI001B8D5FCA|nr:MerR family transcriptional regulator [Gluconobacter sphaericus]MBS1097007.1 MerR family transcriptional regulator [Gluconobacter sphaericus]
MMIDALSIAEVAQRFGIRASALRYYEDIDLLKPTFRKSGRRYYAQAELRRLALIQLLRKAGYLSLREIANILVSNRHDQIVRNILEERVKILDQKIEAAITTKKYLEHRLTCPREDPVNDCPILAGEVDTWLAKCLISGFNVLD